MLEVMFPWLAVAVCLLVPMAEGSLFLTSLRWEVLVLLLALPGAVADSALHLAELGAQSFRAVVLAEVLALFPEPLAVAGLLLSSRHSVVVMLLGCLVLALALVFRPHCRR